MRQTAVEHPEARAYLERLERAARGLPRRERRELVEEIRGHLTVALAEADTEAEVRNAIDALGEPEDIVGATGVTPRRSIPALDVVAVLLLLFGAIVIPLVGWFIGLVLLWMSATWTFREKLLATFVVPGGVPGAFVIATIGTSAVCAAGGSSTAIIDEGTGEILAEVGGTQAGECVVSVFGLPMWAGVPILVTLVLAAVVVPFVLLRRAQGRAAV